MSGRKKGEAEGGEGRGRKGGRGEEEGVYVMFTIKCGRFSFPWEGCEWTGVGTRKEYVYLQSDLLFPNTHTTCTTTQSWYQG